FYIGKTSLDQNHVERVSGYGDFRRNTKSFGGKWLVVEGEARVPDYIEEVGGRKVWNPQSGSLYVIFMSGSWLLFMIFGCSGTQGLKYPLLVKRFACMVISGVATADSLDILQPALLSPEMMVQMQEEFVLLRGALEDIDIADEQIALLIFEIIVLTMQWYTGVLARIRINAFRVELAAGLYTDLFASAAASVEAEAAIGNAVYMLPSFYNHDCDPNAHILWIENVDARLKALRDIEAGEELRICYIDASMGRDARQAILSKGFGFQCRCHRCLSNE
ncbi:hypothetical protein RJ639_004657, partial [Escallonia herrerae]